jgi:hypothetical protein
LKNKKQAIPVDLEIAMMKRLLGVFFLFVTLNVSAQADFDALENDLAFHADVMVNASRSSHRTQAAESFNIEFKKALEKKNSFFHPFDSLEWISKVYAPDSTYRVFTWQLFKSPDDVAYFGFFQSADSLISLQDNSAYTPDLKYEVLTADKWFGQIYYDVQHFSYNGQNHTLFFGARMLDQDTRIKTIEAVDWEGKTLHFGKELFYKQSRHGDSRLMIDYYSQANAQLRYDPELDLLVFDHLIPVVNPYEKNKTIMVPDGTLEAYTFSEGKWKYKEKVFDQKYDKPPVPEPILKDQKKDLFGR